MTTDQPHALLSVSDKTGIESFARGLDELGYRLVSTGGTASRLEAAGLEVVEVSEITGVPELFDGRVKTLHPKIHGGVLARESHPEDRETRERHGIPRFDVVAVNLYPFEETIRERPGDLAEACEMIDIGGPTLLRAAAKNFESTLVVVDHEDYSRVVEALGEGAVDDSLRRRLALEAFRHTARYDGVIAEYFEGNFESDDHRHLPEQWSIGLERTAQLRYGENPHQKGALYRAGSDPDWGGFEKLHGKELSYNNLVDLDAALQLTLEFDRPAASIIKHTNPAGCAVGEELNQAYEWALECDPMSAFGGIVAVNRPVERSLAERMNEKYFEVIAAPGFADEALDVLKQKKNVRLLEMPEEVQSVPRAVRATVLGVVAQTTDPPVELSRESVEIPTEREPTDEEWEALAFNWRVCKHVKSNAIVFGRRNRTLGVGAGQMSRVDSVELAERKCRHALEGSVMASDAFFPFRDAIDAAHEAGIRAVVQPGGSKKDGEVIEACDEHGIAMVMTGKRHFRH